jgi:hypothetical protein
MEVNMFVTKLTEPASKRDWLSYIRNQMIFSLSQEPARYVVRSYVLCNEYQSIGPHGCPGKAINPESGKVMVRLYSH